MPSKRSSKCGPDFCAKSLAKLDPELTSLIESEGQRQQNKLIMIASESMAPNCIREAVASIFTNLYAEGYPPLRMVESSAVHTKDLLYQRAYQNRYGDRRYYKGVDVANYVESLAIHRAREVFATKQTPAAEIYANVQPLSGAAANNAAYQALLRAGDTILSLELTHGGHLTHGHPQNRSGIEYQVVHYHLDPKTGRLDYDQIISLAEEYKPRIIVAGYSAYPWSIDWQRFRQAADVAGGYLMADIAHVAGLVAGGVYPSPVGYADVITFTTHKSLMGPRGAIILTTKRELAEAVDKAVFPGEQGGPHVNQIAAKAAVLGLAATPEYKKLQKKVVENAAHLARALTNEGLTLAYGGTDTHMVLLDLRSLKGQNGYPLTGEILSRVLDLVGISCNKNTIAGDTNAAHPGAIRLGTPWATQLGLGKPEMRRIAGIIAKVAKSIIPFYYNDTGGEIGRGKAKWEIQEEARAEVAELLADFNEAPPVPKPANPLEEIYRSKKIRLTKSGSALLPVAFTGEETAAGPYILDRTDSEVFTAYGDPHRLLPFLSELTTCDALHLLPDKCQRGFVLGLNGQLLTDITLIRRKDEQGLAHVTIIAGPCRKYCVRSWFAAVSDGYTLFDDQDLISKVQGPVVFTDIVGQTLLTLVSKNAIQYATSHLPEIRQLKSGHALELDSKDGPLTACLFDHKDQEQILQIIQDDNKAQKLWTRLTSGENSFSPLGKAAADRQLKKLGLLVTKDSTIAKPPAAADPGYFHFDKPYFVGQRLVKVVQTGKAAEPFVWSEPKIKNRRTCLYKNHLKRARKNYIVPFGGWEMPVRYGAIIEEHQAVRNAAGLFDVSHMGVIEIAGRGATIFLDLLTTNYVPWLEPGQSHYSYLLDADGNVLDDLMIYKRGQEQYLVVVNAGNFEKVFAYLLAVNQNKILLDRDFPYKTRPFAVRIQDLKDIKAGAKMLVDLALQGPASLDLVTSLIDDQRAARQVSQLRRNEFISTSILGQTGLISTTGYTGEQTAFELYVHPSHAPLIWETLLDRGQKSGLVPCGLGARDSLRTEAGLPLYGHELAGAHDIGPGGAGYGAFVKLHKPFFVGKTAYLAQERKRDRQIIRFEIPGKGNRPAKIGDLVLDRNGRIVGQVTSSASLSERQVGLAYVIKNYIKPDLEISLVSGQDTPSSNELGTRLPLPVAGRIISRFPSPK